MSQPKHHPYLVFKLVCLSLVSAIQTVWRRIRRGPVAEDWSLGLEIFVDSTRKILVEMNTWSPVLMQEVAANGLPCRLPKQVRFSQVSLGGITAEHTIVPDAEDGAVLFYIHGGGTVLGSPKSHRDIISRIALQAGICAYSPDYRLAPQNPFPAGLEDVFCAYNALLEMGIQANKIVVAGDSAGGALTFALLLKLRESGLPDPRAAVALSPATDLTFPGDSWVRNLKTDYLSGDIVNKWAGYYGDSELLSHNSLVSATHGELEGFPPVLVQAGTGECLYDDIVVFVEKLKTAQVEVDFESYPRMPHVWHFYRTVTPHGDAAIQSIADYIRKRIC